MLSLGGDRHGNATETLGIASKSAQRDEFLPRILTNVNLYPYSLTLSLGIPLTDRIAPMIFCSVRPLYRLGEYTRDRAYRRKTFSA